MSIEYPVRVERDFGRIEVHIRDAANRVIAAGLIGVDAQEIVDAMNAQFGPKGKAKKIRVEEALRRSDLTAQTVGREDIEYGHHESLPRGEHVARLGGKK